ncbi:MAG: hypothetical protein FJ318_07860 [SAR202 cluster bacterium]|nr:hypothetical protein [SAR202 cluster bacterium]
MTNPAANNAALDITPGNIAAAAGLRGMFRSIGGIGSTATIALVLSLFDDKAAAMRYVLLGMSVLVLASLPLVRLMPDRDSRRPASGDAVELPGG